MLAHRGGVVKLGVAALFLWSLPAAAQTALESGPHYRVRYIRVDNHDLYEPTTPQYRKLPYKLLNQLHVQTRRGVLQRELLFAEGDVVTPELLAETERNLRATSYLRAASVTLLPVTTGPGTAPIPEADVLVRTDDAWTTNILLAIDKSGGRLTGNIGVEERNLLGAGKRALLAYRQDLDRVIREVGYTDPRLFESRSQLNVHLESRTDGHETLTELGRPFFSLDTPWSASGRFLDRTEVNRIFKDGAEEVRFTQDRRVISLSGAALADRSGDNLLRLRLGYQFERDLFTPDGPQDPIRIPLARRFGTIRVTASYQRPDFIKETHIERLGRVEDINLGTVAEVMAGWGPPALGSARGTVMGNGSVWQGARLGEDRFLLAQTSLHGRLVAGEPEQVVEEAQVTGYWKLAPWQTAVLHGEGQAGQNLTRDTQFLLGGGSGLRGYPVRQFAGDRRVLLFAEDRFFLAEDFLSLIDLGLVIFLDAGYAWPSDSRVRFSDIKKDVGAGFRYALSRSMKALAIRIDAAYALDSVPGVRSRFFFSFGAVQPF